MTIQNKKCRQLISKSYGFCDRLNMNVPASFCQLVCQGRPEEWGRQSIKETRIKKFLKIPLPKSTSDNEITTVIIPAVEEDREYLERTIKSVKDNALGSIEVIVVADGWTGTNGELSYPKRIGLRKAMNLAAEKAKGKYLVKLDGHCAMSPEWDNRLKVACKGKMITVPAIDHLNTDTWTGEGGDMSFVTLDGSLRMQYVHPYEYKGECPLESDIISMTACCWMMEKDYYFELGGCDEELGVWGELGAEWALKAWLTGGRMMLRADVVCSHLFRKTTPFTIDSVVRRNALRKMCCQWILGKDKRRTRTPGWMIEKFAYMNKKDIPLFGLGGKGYSIRDKDWKFLRAFVQKNNLKNILEFGAGKSTLMFDNLGCNVISYDTLPFYAKTVQALSSKRVQVRHWDNKQIKGRFDLLFIDGPAGGENREQSYKIGSKANARYIACHDANRKWESKWIDKYLSNRKCVASMDDNVIKVFE